ncbi:unnamed protein product (macronuclear) [Paramecium tetraurelia]|uniref:Carboxypeptidase n=1 Tax=Paramecium tetraurelia TaxID=5888 RepID=A0EHX4_PARTE|nr:uncharacterized protein GSPATT00027242001 [Paramecium tetraurelia]CAK94915.1 unnamed protein product [Paramecium tetraurelia]|eukprot:XP_001462288.1 hypothetical protein (macronuclear) [Paramecium tetraurelia strain d4-2]
MSYLIAALTILMTMAVDPKEDKAIFPGWGDYNFNTYSGYIPIGTGQRQLHYVFLESQGDPSTDPVVLWLNGGPGCSSLLGLNEEIGPFVMADEDREFKKNPYSWNTVANLLFLESPAGVGFSVNKDTFYVYNDTNTGEDNYQAILSWFSAFKQFQGRAFYIAGESYAGMYIPYTSKAILEGNKVSSLRISLRGIMIGNGLLVSDPKKRFYALQEYFLRRNFMPPTTTNTIRKICQVAPESIKCLLAQSHFEEVCLGSNINIYNVYGYCKEDSTPDFLKSKHQTQKKVKYPYVPWFEGNRVENKGKDNGAPCTDFGPITEYYNRQDVQKALHIQDQPVLWNACNLQINENYHISEAGSYQILAQLRDEYGQQILIYSGDLDAIVSVVDTEQAILMVPGIRETTPWRPWGNKDLDLAGWVTYYDKLTFAVVRGAGHMVPQDQRQNGFELFQSFIYNLILPEHIEKQQIY